MSKRPLILVGAAAATAVLAFTACSGGGGGGGADDAGNGGSGAAFSLDFSNLATTTPSGPADVDTVTWNLPYEPLSLDPMFTYNYAENTVISNLCESLMRLTPEFEIENGLAEKVENPDDRTVVYTLRSDATFWDGSPVTADDVVYSLGRQVGSDSPSYYADYFVSVDSVEKTGDNEVTVHLKEPDALFEQAMSSAAGAIVQQAAAEAAGEKFGTPQGGLMCSGPFQFASWDSGKKLHLEKNAEYWDEALVPRVEKLDFTFIADESTAINSLRSGDSDGQFFYLPPAGLTQIEGSDAEIVFGESFTMWTMRATNTEGPFSKPEVRAALLAAIDRQAIGDVVFQGAAAPAPVLTGPSYFGSGPQAALFQEAFDGFSTEPDVEKAQEMLAEAGDVSGKIVLGVQGSSAVHEQTANLIQAAGQAIGLDIETKVIPVEQFGNLYFDETSREGLDGFFTTYYGDFADPLSVYAALAPGGTGNFTDYAEAGDDIAEARRTLDPAARAEHTIAAQEKITRDLPWVPFNYMPVIMVQNSGISGAVPSSAYLSYPWAATIGGVE